jgi:NitT/TauT family transport system ATP-binding protein
MTPENTAKTRPPSTAEGEPGTEIVVDGVTHEFRDRRTGEAVRALDGVDLTVRKGEFVTVVGPSGCGKSTLLKALAGLLRPTAGTITCAGKRVVGPGRDRGMVFQELAIMPWRTVRRNIAHGLEIQGVPRRERDERVARLIELMNLGGFEDRYPHELSDPPIVLMDEPFAAVDAQTRLTLQAELLRVSLLAGSTLVFITHNTEEAVFLGDRVAVMSRRPGRIKEIVDVPVPRGDRDIGSMLRDPDVRERQERVLRLVREEVG